MDENHEREGSYHRGANLFQVAVFLLYGVTIVHTQLELFSAG